ncbi:hypothetical protein ACHAW5_004382 [Stephanodiscus triporus]|uniref:Geranylgeranyl transferase type-2 subunit alpha n=1 Tax=Stephanodiscus triporus TaxID=2934178 RepID=A0ABD3QCT7_9STRA
MHGQKRSEYKSRLLNPKTSSKLATKAQQWNHLSHELLTQRRRLLDPAPPPAGTADAAGNDDRVAKPSSKILLTLTEKMLSVNPDPSHLWNIRREMLLYIPKMEEDAVVETDPIRPSVTNLPNIDIQPELTLTAHCLQRNPKAYSAWHHRKWSLVHFLTNPTLEVDCSTSFPETDDARKILRSELELCSQLLQLDERNFHCWNYRRFVVALLGSCGVRSTSGSVQDAAEDLAANSNVDLFSGSWSSWLNRQSQVSMGAQLLPSAIKFSSNKGMNCEGVQYIAKTISMLTQEELEEIINNEWNFTNSKIQDNFSNGSAFHYRSKLLPLMLEFRLQSSHSPAARYKESLVLAREEWENILLNAIFTEPDDQWWYHRFIVSWVKPSADVGDEMLLEYETLLFEMADSLRELLEVEKENGALGNAVDRDESKGAKCKWAYLGLHLVLSTLLESKILAEGKAADLIEEAGECLTELIQIDPNRRERYQNFAAEIIRA